MESPKNFAAGLGIGLSVGGFLHWYLGGYIRSFGKSEPPPLLLTQEAMKDFVCAQKRTVQYFPPNGETALMGKAKLKSRSIPNQRLKAFFGIENTFTTVDGKVSAKFIQQAISRMMRSIGLQGQEKRDLQGKEKSNQEGDWTMLIGTIRGAVEVEIGASGSEINIAELIQFVTLKVSLQFLFPNRPGTNDPEATRYVAKRINELWIKSKDYKPGANLVAATETGWNQEHDLRTHLRNLTGADPDIPLENPLNFILPAYETMWRAVFKGVLEIYFRGSAGQNEWKDLLFDFLNNPTKAKFNNREESSNTEYSCSGEQSRDREDPSILSAKDIVKEILRLHPPTRHVYRQFPGSKLGKFHKADIETCHRLPLLAGKFPERFQPERWLDIKFWYNKECDDRGASDKKFTLKDYEEALGFMPFAISCPAGKGMAQGFGFKMIALLVAAVCEAFDRFPKTSWRLEPSADKVFPPLNQALNAGREEYLHLVYKRVDEAMNEDGMKLTEEDVDVLVIEDTFNAHGATVESDNSEQAE